MAERDDRIDYWYFTEDMNAVNAPNHDAETQVIFEHGGVLVLNHYLQNNYGIWGYYEIPTPSKLVRRYILLYDGDRYLARHTVIEIQ